MTIGDWLKTTVETLGKAGVATARLDALVLLEDATNHDRAWLLAHPDFELTSSQANELASSITRRAQHEPLAYIRGKSEFYGREFAVNAHTLEPRPETETMLELLFEQVKSKKIELENIVDVGTGSGCIAITAKLELPKIEVFATDIDAKCIQAAKKNAASLEAGVSFHEGNLLESLPPAVYRPSSTLAILANLPYVPAKYELNAAAKFEPKHAIFGGNDGLDLYRELFAQIDNAPHKPRLIMTESLPPQHTELAAIASRSGYQLAQTDDFIQVFRPS